MLKQLAEDACGLQAIGSELQKYFGVLIEHGTLLYLPDGQNGAHPTRGRDGILATTQAVAPDPFQDLASVRGWQIRAKNGSSRALVYRG